MLILAAVIAHAAASDNLLRDDRASRTAELGRVIARSGIKILFQLPHAVIAPRAWLREREAEKQREREREREELRHRCKYRSLEAG